MTPTPKPSLAARIAQGLAALSFFSVWLGGLLGAAVVATVGPALAMGMQMYLSFNTEPVMPTLAFPWPLAGLFGVLPLPLAARRSWKLAGLLAAPLWGLCLWQMRRLYDSAGAPL